jgi:hypothetical protein
MKYKCIVKKCHELANYNYKTCFNAAYCYWHKSSDMVKFGKYDIYDFIDLESYGIGIGRFFTP